MISDDIDKINENLKLLKRRLGDASKTI